MFGRWERLKETLAKAGIESTIDSRSYPGGTSYSMTFSLGEPGWTVEVRDQWWRKNRDIWIGWEIGVVDPEGVWVREWPKTKNRRDVAEAVAAGHEFFQREKGHPMSAIAHPAATEIHYAEVTKIRQGYGLLRVYRVDVADRTYAVRVDIERNAYDEQSHYRTELLTPAGWTPLHRIPPESDDVTKLPSYVCWRNANRGDCVEQVEYLADRLVTESVAILSTL